MEFVKKQRVGFWLYALVAILSIITLVIYISNVNSAYYQDMNKKVIWLMLGAILLTGIVLVLPQITQKPFAKILIDISCVGIAALLIVAGVTFISMRVESFGYIFGSNLELGNDAAFSAGSQAIVGIGFFLVTWLFSLVASFLEVVKKD